MTQPLTLFDKIWAQHEILKADNGLSLVWIDRHYVHEGSFQGFDKVDARGQRVARPDLTFASAAEARARIRIYWASSRMRLYGEAHPIMVDGKRGASIYVNPDVTQLGDEIDAATSGDRLLRDAIVYLTCLHESGHALGLAHTGRFEDIMYSFGYGGDIVEYFERYRRKIAARAEIREHSGISDRDRERLLELYRKRQ